MKNVHTQKLPFYDDIDFRVYFSTLKVNSAVGLADLGLFRVLDSSDLTQKIDFGQKKHRFYPLVHFQQITEGLKLNEQKI